MKCPADVVTACDRGRECKCSFCKDHCVCDLSEEYHICHRCGETLHKDNSDCRPHQHIMKRVSYSKKCKDCHKKEKEK